MSALLPILSLSVRVLLAAVFASGAAAKLRDLSAFRGTVEGYRLVPVPAAGAVAVGVAGSEALLACWLLTGWWPDGARVATMAVLTLFTAAIAVNLWRGRSDIDCGCTFGGGDFRIGPGLVLRNAGMIVLVAMLPATAVADAQGVVSGVGAGLAVFAFWIAASALRRTGVATVVFLEGRS